MNLPRYECHKIVNAIKIKEISFGVDGAAYVIPELEGIPRIEISSQYRADEQPQAGGYYVVEHDGNPEARRELYYTAPEFEAEYQVIPETENK